MFPLAECARLSHVRFLFHAAVSDLATLVGREVRYKWKIADSLPFSKGGDSSVQSIHIEGEDHETVLTMDAGTALGRDDQWSFLVPVHPRLTPLAADGTIQALAHQHMTSKVSARTTDLLLAFRHVDSSAVSRRLTQQSSFAGDDAADRIEHEKLMLLRYADRSRHEGEHSASFRQPASSLLRSAAAVGTAARAVTASVTHAAAVSAAAVGHVAKAATSSVMSAGHAATEAAHAATASVFSGGRLPHASVRPAVRAAAPPARVTAVTEASATSRAPVGLPPGSNRAVQSAAVEVIPFADGSTVSVVGVGAIDAGTLAAEISSSETGSSRDADGARAPVMQPPMSSSLVLPAAAADLESGALSAYGQ
jgi:hypothetical protein